MKRLFLAVFLLPFKAYCEDISIIHADSAEYLGENIRCEGNVVIVCNKKVISADKIQSDEKHIEAEGNVIIQDELHNVYLADRVNVTKDFSKGSADNVKIITADKCRLAAGKCEILNEEYHLENVIFTPCFKCTKSGALTWQMKSGKVIFDPKSYTSYEDVVLEAFDVPILYMPHFTHPSHNLKRKSGFLIPKFAMSSQQGFAVLPQYLFSISDSQELIFKPILTTKMGYVPWAYYGIRFFHGEFNVDASITGTKSVDKSSVDRSQNPQIDKISRSNYRGHLFSHFRYEINENWRTGFDTRLTSDRYYLKRFSFFDFPDSRNFETSIFLERFDKRDYFSIKSSMFQNDCTEITPKLLPVIEHNAFFEIFKGTLSINTFASNLDFPEHRISQKFICYPSWSKEILLPFGHILDISLSLSIQGLKVSEDQKSMYDSYFQVLPQIHCCWEWPLVIESPLIPPIVFTPLAGITYATNKKNLDIFESPFDEINEMNFCFNSKSISSYNIDRGKRYFYGAKIDGYCCTRHIYRISLGQSIELTKPIERIESSGLQYKRSNLVGALDVFFTSNLSFCSSASYSSRTSNLDKIESGIAYTQEKMSFAIFGFNGKQCVYNPFATGYLDIKESNLEKKYKGFTVDSSYKINTQLSINGHVAFGNSLNPTNINSKHDNSKLKFVKYAAGCNFENECTKFIIRLERLNRRGGDLRPETSFKFLVQLKKLG